MRTPPPRSGMPLPSLRRFLGGFLSLILAVPWQVLPAFAAEGDPDPAQDPVEDPATPPVDPYERKVFEAQTNPGPYLNAVLAENTFSNVLALDQHFDSLLSGLTSGRRRLSGSDIAFLEEFRRLYNERMAAGNPSRALRYLADDPGVKELLARFNELKPLTAPAGTTATTGTAGRRRDDREIKPADLRPAAGALKVTREGVTGQEIGAVVDGNSRPAGSEPELPPGKARSGRVTDSPTAGADTYQRPTLTLAAFAAPPPAITPKTAVPTAAAALPPELAAAMTNLERGATRWRPEHSWGEYGVDRESGRWRQSWNELARAGAPAVPALSAALESSNANVAAGALRALASMSGDVKLDDATLQQAARAGARLLQTNDALLRMQVLQGLSGLPVRDSKEAAAAALAVLTQNGSPADAPEWKLEADKMALRFLKDLGAQAADSAPALAALLDQREGRRDILEALSVIAPGDPAVVKRVAALLGGRPPLDANDTAAALALLKAAGPAGRPASSAVVAILLDPARKKEAGAAAAALAAISGDGPVAAMARDYVKAEGPARGVIGQALRLAASSDMKGLNAKLIEVLGGGDPAARLAAARLLPLLGKDGAPSLPALLAAAVAGSNGSSRQEGDAYADVLLALRGRFAAGEVSGLISLLAVDSARAQRAAAELLSSPELAGLITPAHITALAKLAKPSGAYDPERPRINAIELLAALGERARPAIPALIAVMGEQAYHPSVERGLSDVRKAAAKTLSALGPPRPEDLPELTRLLGSENAGSRDAAADVLKSYGPKAAAALTAALGLESPDARTGALGVLVSLGKDALPALAEGLGRTKGPHRQEILLAIDRLGLAWPEARASVPALLAVLAEDRLPSAAGGRFLPERSEAHRTAALNALERIARADRGAAAAIAAGTPELLTAALKERRSLERDSGRDDLILARQRLLAVAAPEAAAEAAAAQFHSGDRARMGPALELIAALALAGKPVAGISADDLEGVLRPRDGRLHMPTRVFSAALALDALFPERSEAAVAAVTGYPNLSYDEKFRLVETLGRFTNGREAAATKLAGMLASNAPGVGGAILTPAAARALIDSGRGRDRAGADLAMLLAHSNKEVRALAQAEAAEVARTDPEQALVLLGALGTGDRDLRINILTSVAGLELDPAKALPLLVGFLGGDGRDDPGMAEAVSRARELALGLAGEKDPARPFIEALGSNNERTRLAARQVLRALAPGGDPAEALKVLSAALHQAEDWDLRVFSVQGLAAIAPLRPEAGAELAWALVIEDNRVVPAAHQALAALGPTVVPHISRKMHLEPYQTARALMAAGAPGIEAVAAFVADERRPVADRVKAARALDSNFGLLQPELAGRIAESLEAALPKVPEPYRVVELVETIGSLGGPRADAALIRLLDHSDPTVRIEAAEVLTENPDMAARAEPALLAAAVSKDEVDRHKAIEALGRIGSERGVALLARHADAYALGRVLLFGRGPMRAEALRLLSVSAAEGPVGERLQAVKSLAQAREGGPDVVTVLTAALASPEAAVRVAAADALGAAGLRSEAAAAALTRSLADPDRKVRLRSMEALALLAAADPWSVPDAAVPALEAAIRRGLNERLSSSGPGYYSEGPDEEIPAAGAKALGALGARALPAAATLRELAGSANWDVRVAGERGLRSLQTSAQTPDPRRFAGVPTSELITRAGAALGDPDSFDALAGALAGRGAESREALPLLYRTARLDVASAEDPAKAARVKAAAFKALADLDPESLVTLAGELAPAGAPAPPPSTALSAQAGLEGAIGLARALPFFDALFPNPDRAWRVDAERRLAALKEQGAVRWYGEQAYTGPDGVRRRGLGTQSANGAYRFESPDGFYVMIAPDGSAETGNVNTGARVHADTKFTTVYDPFTKSLQRTPRGEKDSDVSWEQSSYFTGILGSYHGRSFMRPAGEYPILQADGSLIFYRDQEGGPPVMTGWLERSVAEGGKEEFHSYESLGGGFGYVRDEKHVILTPQTLQAVREGRLDLSAIPQSLVPDSQRSAFEGAIRAAASMTPELDAAFRGDRRVSKQGVERYSVQNAEIFYDEKDHAYRLRISVARGSEDGNTPPSVSQFVVVPSQLGRTSVFVSRDGQNPLVYRFDPAFERVWRQEVSKQEWANGRMRFVDTQARSVVDGRWSDWRGAGGNPPPEEPGALEKGMGYIGTGAEVIFSPVQTVLYGILAESQFLISDAAELANLVGVDGANEAADFFRANGIYTVSQAKFVRWGVGGEEADYQQRVYQLARANMRQGTRSMLDASMSHEFRLAQEKIYGEAAFLYRPGFEEQSNTMEARAAQAGGIFGAGNTAGAFIRDGEKDWERGDVWGAALNYAAGGGFIIGEGYVTGFGFGVMATPLKVGAAGLVGARGVTAVERALLTQKNLRNINIAENVLLNAPGLYHSVTSLSDWLAAAGNGDSDTTERFSRFFESTAGFGGLGLGLLVAQTHGKNRLPSAGESMKALKLDTAALRGLSPEAVVSRVEAAYRAEWAATRNLSGAELEAATTRLRGARDSLFQIVMADVAAAEAPATKKPAPAERPAASPSELASLRPTVAEVQGRAAPVPADVMPAARAVMRTQPSGRLGALAEPPAGAPAQPVPASVAAVRQFLSSADGTLSYLEQTGGSGSPLHKRLSAFLERHGASNTDPARLSVGQARELTFEFFEALGDRNTVFDLKNALRADERGGGLNRARYESDSLLGDIPPGHALADLGGFFMQVDVLMSRGGVEYSLQYGAADAVDRSAGTRALQADRLTRAIEALEASGRAPAQLEVLRGQLRTLREGGDVQTWGDSHHYEIMERPGAAPGQSLENAVNILRTGQIREGTGGAGGGDSGVWTQRGTPTTGEAEFTFRFFPGGKARGEFRNGETYPFWSKKTGGPLDLAQVDGLQVIGRSRQSLQNLADGLIAKGALTEADVVRSPSGEVTGLKLNGRDVRLMTIEEYNGGGVFSAPGFDPVAAPRVTARAAGSAPSTELASAMREAPRGSMVNADRMIAAIRGQMIAEGVPLAVVEKLQFEKKDFFAFDSAGTGEITLGVDAYGRTILGRAWHEAQHAIDILSETASPAQVTDAAVKTKAVRESKGLSAAERDRIFAAYENQPLEIRARVREYLTELDRLGARLKRLEDRAAGRYGPEEVPGRIQDVLEAGRDLMAEYASRLVDLRVRALENEMIEGVRGTGRAAADGPLQLRGRALVERGVPELLRLSPELGLVPGGKLRAGYEAAQNSGGGDIFLARGRDPNLPHMISALESASSKLRAAVAEAPAGPKRAAAQEAYSANQEHLSQLRLYRTHAEWVDAGAEVVGVIGRAEYLRLNPLGKNALDNVPDAPHVYYRLRYNPDNPTAFDLNRTAGNAGGLLGNWMGVHSRTFARPTVNQEALAAPDVNTAGFWRRLQPVTPASPERIVMLRPVARLEATPGYPDGMVHTPDGTVYGRPNPGGRLEVLSGKTMTLPDGSVSAPQPFLDAAFTVRTTRSPGELPVAGSERAGIRLSERITTELFEPSDPRLKSPVDRDSPEFRAKYEAMSREIRDLHARLEREAPDQAARIRESLEVLEEQLAEVKPPPAQPPLLTRAVQAAANAPSVLLSIMTGRRGRSDEATAGRAPRETTPPLERYFTREAFAKLHPEGDGAVYHDAAHSENVARLAYESAVARGASPADALFIYQVGLLHDLDPGRAPGSPARVPATLEALRADFTGTMSLDGAAGESVLVKRFGWGRSDLARAEAMIQRTEFPFGDAHQNPHYKDASPLARYEAMLAAMSPADRAFVLREGPMLSEYGDKASWYALVDFPTAMRSVEGLANEINTVSGGKANMSAGKLDTADFMGIIGEAKAFELDLALARKFGMDAPDLPSSRRGAAAPEGDVAQRFLSTLEGDAGRRFASNLAGFQVYRDAIKAGKPHAEAVELASRRASAAFRASERSLTAPLTEAPSGGLLDRAIGTLAAVFEGPSGRAKPEPKPRPEAYGELQALSVPVRTAAEFPGGSGGVETRGLPVRALRTATIPAETLGYNNDLRPAVEPRAPARSVAELPRADVVDISDVAFGSDHYSGSNGVVRLARLRDGRVVAVKSVHPIEYPGAKPETTAAHEAWMLQEANSAALYSDLGFGARYHGVWAGADGRLMLVTDIARGDFSGTPVTARSFTDLETIISRMRGAGIAEVGDFQLYRTPEGRLVGIDAVGATAAVGVKPEKAPDASGGFAAGERFALLREAPPDVGRRYLEGLRTSDPAAFKGLAEGLLKSDESWGRQRYGELLRPPSGRARPAAVGEGDTALATADGAPVPLEALHAAVSEGRAFIRSQIDHQPVDLAADGPLSSKSMGACGLSSGCLMHVLQGDGVQAVPHQAADVFGRDSYRHSFLFVPLRRYVDGRWVSDASRGVYLDATFKQFNLRQLQLEYPNSPNTRYGPVQVLSRTPEGRALLKSILKDGYAVVDDAGLALLAEAMTADPRTGVTNDSVRRPTVRDMLKATDPTIYGPEGSSSEYMPSDFRTLDAARRPPTELASLRRPAETPAAGAPTGFNRFLRAVGLGSQAAPEIPVTTLGHGEAGVVLQFQRPGESPMAVKVSRTGPGRLNARAWEEFLDEAERVGSVSRALDRSPVPNFEVPRPSHPTFTPGELRALKAAADRGAPGGVPGEVVANGQMVVTNVVPGQTLKAYFEGGGRLAPAEAKVILDGLRALNAQGFFAFDLKSDNMMVYNDPVRGLVFTLIDTGAMKFETPGKGRDYTSARERQDGLFEGMVRPFVDMPAAGAAPAPRTPTTQGRALPEPGAARPGPPLKPGQILGDANAAIALERMQSDPDGLNPAHRASLARLGDSELRLTSQGFAETGYGGPGVVAPLTVSRTDPAYLAVIKVLETANLGQRKGNGDRATVADAFFTATSDGGPVTFLSADKSVYNTLARLGGIDPAKLGGKTVPSAYPDGFTVTVNGRTIRVLAAGR
ncbi:MAG: HEAT repeat domain-containing protein [Elusimicrobia bacterium]|nr:HEAT repeat domain-containing protein [Elusimicrobiota bacterium]